jgi:hypothetical protein
MLIFNYHCQCVPQAKAPNINKLLITVKSCYVYLVHTSSGSLTMLRTAILNTLVFITLTTSCLSESFQSTGTTGAYFSPKEGATEAIVKDINSAKSKTLVQAYFFASKPIAIALVDDNR